MSRTWLLTGIATVLILAASVSDAQAQSYCYGEQICGRSTIVAGETDVFRLGTGLIGPDFIEYQWIVVESTGNLWRYIHEMTGPSMTSFAYEFNSVGTYTVVLHATRKADGFSPATKVRKIFTVNVTGASRLARFDRNGDRILQDGELLEVVDAWISNRITDQLFFNAIDLWVRSGNITGAGARPSTSTGFSSVRVYSLDGQLLSQHACSLSAKTQAVRTLNHQSLATGTYLMVTQDCLTGQSSSQFVAFTR